MQWWNVFVSWLSSYDGWRVMSTAVIPFVAIVLAGVIAALIGRSSSKRILAFQDRELKAAAVMALIGAGRKATVWSSLGGDEKQRVDSQLSEADIRVRLLPVNGTNAAADWAAHEIAAMKKNSANFSFQAEQTFVDYRNRLLEWQNKPKRARKLFAFDLEQWRYDDESVDKTLVEKQQQWAASHVSDEKSAEAATPAPSAPTRTYESLPAPQTPPTTTAATVAPAIPMPAAAAEEPAAAPAQSASVDTVAQPVVADQPSDLDSENATSEIGDTYAPPVTAGTVRRRTDPDETV